MEEEEEEMEREEKLTAIEEEHVRELVKGNSHGRLQPLRPMLPNRLAPCPSNIQLRQTSRHAIEPGCQNDNVKLPVFSGHAEDPGLGDLGDVVGEQVDELDVRQVVDFVVVLFQ